MLVVIEQSQRQVVVRCCEHARGVGVRPGMPVAQARALFAPADAARVRLEAHEPERDHAALTRLAIWAHCLSPVVSLDTPINSASHTEPDSSDDLLAEPEGILLDMTGSEAVFGGEEHMLDLARQRFDRLGIHARIALAPTVGCAWALARFADASPTRITPGDQRNTLAPLPIAALRVSGETVAALSDVGVETIGQLMELPRSALPARFGGGLLMQLDRALGRLPETIEPIRPLPPPTAGRVFEGPTDRVESIEHAAREVLGEMVRQLRERQMGARLVTLTLHRSDMEPEHLRLTMALPSCDDRHLWSLLRPKLERAHLGFGVEGVACSAGQLRRVGHEQASHWDQPGERAGERSGDRSSGSRWGGEREAAAMIDTLRNRMGIDRVRYATLRASHLPERAVALELEPDRSVPAATPNDRPTLLFERPIPVDVIALTPDGPVHGVRWAGQDHGVACCFGPERLGDEWWRRDAGSTRDYFAVRTERGRWLWLARAIETNRWFIHGVWA